MILAGDIGGTKTNLGLFEMAGGSMRMIREDSFPSRDYTGLEAIIAEFIGDERPPISAACFGIAGPVVEGRSVTPNLPWVVDSLTVARTIKVESVALINDLEATAHGIFELKPEEMLTLNEGDSSTGNAALVAAGTGFGVASLFWDGREHIPSASEGGHVDFAPRNEIEIDLLKYMQTKHKRVSVERVLSGPGLFNIYSFLVDAGYAQESPAIAEEMREDDPSKVIANAALSRECELCVKALDMFVAIYGAAAGNVALLLKSTAGLYVGGGIAPKIIEKLKDGLFIESFMDKGRLTPLVTNIPVRVIMNDKTALLGAARVAARSKPGAH